MCNQSRTISKLSIDRWLLLASNTTLMMIRICGGRRRKATTLIKILALGLMSPKRKKISKEKLNDWLGLEVKNWRSRCRCSSRKRRSNKLKRIKVKALLMIVVKKMILVLMSDLGLNYLTMMRNKLILILK